MGNFPPLMNLIWAHLRLESNYAFLRNNQITETFR
uniref:Uncharacterized protein n=1 Tax=Rhizophora mucronata TaxID=61149 RepID=A0A2P2PYN8_RHIMU